MDRSLPKSLEVRTPPESLTLVREFDMEPEPDASNMIRKSSIDGAPST